MIITNKNNLLKNWELIKVGDSRFVISGFIHSEETNCMEFETSLLKSIDFEKGIAVTINTTYNLEVF